MKHKTFSLVLISAFFVAGSLLVFHLPPDRAQSSSPAPAPHTASSHSRTATYSLFAGLWRVDNGFVSTIQIKNLLIVGPIQVTPVLFMADGTEYDLPPVQLATAGVAAVNVNSAWRALLRVWPVTFRNMAARA